MGKTVIDFMLGMCMAALGVFGVGSCVWVLKFWGGIEWKCNFLDLHCFGYRVRPEFLKILAPRTISIPGYPIFNLLPY